MFPTFTEQIRLESSHLVYTAIPCKVYNQDEDLELLWMCDWFIKLMPTLLHKRKIPANSFLAS